MFGAVTTEAESKRPAPERRPCFRFPLCAPRQRPGCADPPQRLFSRRRLLSRGAAPVVAFALLEAAVLSLTRIGLLPLMAVARSSLRGALELAVLSRTRIGLLPLIAVARSTLRGGLPLAVLSRI